MSDTLYETFCDRSYYDLWCVRKVGETRWGYCYHMNSKDEAEGLVKQLTDLERELAEARKELWNTISAMADLCAENAELKKDSARLDWLDVDATEHATLAFNKWYEGGGNFRAAIDAAMEAAR